MSGNFFNLKQYLSSNKRVIDCKLDEFFKTDNDHMKYPRIVEAMRYSLLGGGKRIRPILCMAAAEAVNPGAQSDESVLNAACALEMIHTYSLIHDDLPAMDNDNLRRGNPTCHVAFDEATAILAGDALLTLAFHTFSKSLSCNNPDSASRTLEVIHLLSTAAGYQGMVEGQMRDMLFEGVKLKLEDLQSLHLHKTGALIEASVCCGAILSGAASGTVEQLRHFAKNIGLAFQVADDILNIEGDPVLLGKSIGTDQVREKNTYPSIIGLEASKVMARDLVAKGLQAISDFGNTAQPLREIALYIIQRRR